jgi:outer membrane beta-barrel protein
MALRAAGPVLLVLVTLHVAAARAEPASPDPRAIPPILDAAYRHRKRHQVELALSGGTYLSAPLKKSWIVGARAHFHLNNMFALGAGYGFSRHAVNVLDSGTVLSEHNAHYLTGEGALSTDVALRFGRTLVEMDLYMTLGAGARQLNGGWGPLGLIGGGVKFYTGLSWLAVRIDVNNYLHAVQLVGGSQTTVDVSFALGVAFLLPPNPSPLERR